MGKKNKSKKPTGVERSESTEEEPRSPASGSESAPDIDDVDEPEPRQPGAADMAHDADVASEVIQEAGQPGAADMTHDAEVASEVIQEAGQPGAADMAHDADVANEFTQDTAGAQASTEPPVDNPLNALMGSADQLTAHIDLTEDPLGSLPLPAADAPPGGGGPSPVDPLPPLGGPPLLVQDHSPEGPGSPPPLDSSFVDQWSTHTAHGYPPERDHDPLQGEGGSSPLQEGVEEGATRHGEAGLLGASQEESDLLGTAQGDTYLISSNPLDALTSDGSAEVYELEVEAFVPVADDSQEPDAVGSTEVPVAVDSTEVPVAVDRTEVPVAVDSADVHVAGGSTGEAHLSDAQTLSGDMDPLGWATCQVQAPPLEDPLSPSSSSCPFSPISDAGRELPPSHPEDPLSPSSPPCPFSPISDAGRGPPPTPPGMSLDEATLQKLRLQQQVPETRFCMSEITNNKMFEEAARRELEQASGIKPEADKNKVSSEGSAGAPAKGMAQVPAPQKSSEIPGDPSWCLVPKEVPSTRGEAGAKEGESESVHESELQLQARAVMAIDREVGQESSLIREAIESLTTRLETSKRALEGLLRLLQGMAAAESTYATAMLNASKLNIGDQGYGPNLTDAMSTLTGLPGVVSQSHRCLHAQLTTQAMTCTQLVQRFKAAASNSPTEAAKLRKAVESGRSAMTSAFREHAAACRLLDTVLADRSSGRTSGGPQLDPWSTEGKLVQVHKSLVMNLEAERAFLKRTALLVENLELTRLRAGKQVASVGTDSYLACMMPIQQELGAISTQAYSTDIQINLFDILMPSSAATQAAESMAKQHPPLIDGLCQEPLCSSEIIRQSGMQYWHNKSSSLMTPFKQGASWVEAHFVLTRAGFLYWFKTMEDVVPQGMLSLSRCEFETGTPPCFNIVEDAAIASNMGKAGGWLGGVLQRKMTFQAPDVDECCEWALAIREAISVAHGRALAFEDN